MATILPMLPTGDFKFTYVPNALDHTPGGGGETQRINRLGDRFQVETTFKARGEQGVALLALLNSSRGSKVRLPIPQEIDIGSPGTSVLVDGANTGTALDLKGLPNGYVLKAGQFITVVKSGKRYLHQIVEESTANGSGLAATTIVPMLRTPLVGDEVVEVSEPSIEGYLTAREGEWVANGWLKSIALTVGVKEAE